MSKTLLLADDSVVIQKLVGLSFANEDVELSTTDNGDDAIARARELKPDLILADVVMPGKSGYDVCREVRRRELPAARASEVAQQAPAVVEGRRPLGRRLLGSGELGRLLGEQKSDVYLALSIVTPGRSCRDRKSSSQSCPSPTQKAG